MSRSSWAAPRSRGLRDREVRVQANPNLGRQQPLQSAAEKTEKVKQEKGSKGDEQHHDDNRRARMNGGHPSQPNGKNVFAQT
jgi:hypothetical protein